MRIANILFICLICIMLTACSNMKTNVDYWSPIHSYHSTLPYDGGYFFTGDNKTKILLEFYRPNIPFCKDTNARLHIYIVYDGKDIKAFDTEKVKVFFIRVQTGPIWGYMKFEELRLDEFAEKIVISGKLATLKTYPDDFRDTRINLSFEHLPLSYLDSFEKLQKQSYDFYKERLKELFYNEWYR